MTTDDPASRTPPPAASLWIGTYAGGGGEGLYPLRRGDDRWHAGAPDPAACNASFDTYSPRFDLHYIVDEHADTIGVFRSMGTQWDCLARVSAGGAAPCHIALDRRQSCIAVANYADGSVALYRLDPTSGLPIGAPIIYTARGSGPNPERQQSPHAHWVGFSLDNRWLYATDLGADLVRAFAFDADRGTLGAPSTALVAPPGSGPRHLLVHPRQPGSAYLACELSNTLIALDVDGAVVRPRKTVSTLPAAATGDSIVAHIAANAAGDRLYVSNRGDNSIAVFALAAGGDPVLLQHAPSGGASPRFFRLVENERRVVVAHERDHRVTELAILEDGTLAPTGTGITVPGAAYVLEAFSSAQIR
ncbi:hypothetical protein ASF00_00390 [Sphingomonas sp. Leaf34]|uniref:lactonase family protein n=1 Tax=Sphingomonas sp. Leaf34 TaxID=1736216 RepID=UPI0006F615AB|nr:lactonase family protein [Sphingomonas sp. Leaf34]KQN32177.1 hypothetical protein ASF00_00390 [Sphingomonas sp. Leaf34]